MILTRAQFGQISSNEADDIYALCRDAVAYMDVNEATGFLATLAVESCEFTRLEENFNYSAKRLVAVWPRRFTAESAQAFAHKPRKLANYVYSGRLGNGDATSGDGWRYRGRGFIQLTGKANYEEYGFAEEPDLLLQPAIAMDVALLYWARNELGAISQPDWRALRKAVNGGYTGLIQLQNYAVRLMTMWG